MIEPVEVAFPHYCEETSEILSRIFAFDRMEGIFKTEIADKGDGLSHLHVAFEQRYARPGESLNAGALSSLGRGSILLCGVPDKPTSLLFSDAPHSQAIRDERSNHSNNQGIQMACSVHDLAPFLLWRTTFHLVSAQLA